MYEKKDLYICGNDGYHTYRIPAIVVTTRGTILAFCEARKNSSSDTGHIDIVLKRSMDNGKSWSRMKVIASEGTNTIGNPCPVVDRDTGTVWMLFCRNLENGGEDKIMKGEAPREVYVTKSIDEGETWSEPMEITKDVKLSDWTWYATGPCHGTQLRAGRLIVPCDHAVLGNKKDSLHPVSSHVVYSDDHGISWKLGGGPGEKNTDECAVAEMPDGRVYMNMRSNNGKNRRVFSISGDGGISWSEVKLDEALVDPVCQGSVINYMHADRECILFSNAASTCRENMTIRASFDGCLTWPVSQVLYEGPSAYSDLAVASDGSICCMFEYGEKHPYEKLMFIRLDSKWLAGGLS